MPEKTEEDWKAKSDANVLAEAEGIKSDEKRFGRAKEAAKRMLAEQEARAKALKSLAGDKKPPRGMYDKTPEMKDKD
jgi:hypothetical protein